MARPLRARACAGGRRFTRKPTPCACEGTSSHPLILRRARYVYLAPSGAPTRSPTLFCPAAENAAPFLSHTVATIWRRLSQL
jgi:hypothetical protein